MNNKIQELEERKAAVKSNTRLSELGKQETLEAIKTEYRGLISTLRKEAIQAAVEAKKLRLAKSGAQEELETKWDYARLQYEAAAAKSVIAQSDSGFAALPAWDRVKASGDQHMIKAWVDVVPGVANNLAGYESSGLRQSLQDGQKLLQTGEMNAFDDRLKAINDKYDEIGRDVVLVEEGVLGGKVRFPNLAKRVFDGIERSKDGELLLKLEIPKDIPPGFSEADALYRQSEDKHREEIEALNKHYAEKGLDAVLDADIDTL